MVGNTGTLMTMSIRSKLRKRDEPFPPVNTFVNIEAQQHDVGRRSRTNSLDNNQYDEVRDQQLKFFKSDNTSTNSSLEIETITFTRTSGGRSTPNSWIFPPKAPSPNIYNCINHVSTQPKTTSNAAICLFLFSKLVILCKLLVFGTICAH